MKLAMKSWNLLQLFVRSSPSPRSELPDPTRRLNTHTERHRGHVKGFQELAVFLTVKVFLSVSKSAPKPIIENKSTAQLLPDTKGFAPRRVLAQNIQEHKELLAHSIV
ncbi:hypothetical protein PHYPSEUDO_011512 [Phytophthora pseudosyringae]|uniref:Uncharacterized protein n=1 Tax=Phytophthora pseudosyringae TaxID=221518 RepID=A0A8T1VBM5_9STRA|nr:hypothetical protein PHYPSEUDO_011512 [Phytophthora pseudosyringae]